MGRLEIEKEKWNELFCRFGFVKKKVDNYQGRR